MRHIASLFQFSRFGLVGVLATAIHYGVALLMILATNTYLANLLGYCTAVGVSYIGHQRFTFRITLDSASHGRRLPKFIATSLSALILSQLVLAGTAAVGLEEAIGLAVAVLSVPPYTFLLSRLWVFR